MALFVSSNFLMAAARSTIAIAVAVVVSPLARACSVEVRRLSTEMRYSWTSSKCFVMSLVKPSSSCHSSLAKLGFPVDPVWLFGVMVALPR